MVRVPRGTMVKRHAFSLICAMHVIPGLIVHPVPGAVLGTLILASFSMSESVPGNVSRLEVHEIQRGLAADG